ncbi:MFS transporter [Micromonospora peucetia]|uniref:Predicted arabinose efflux permease, MFS family n=2 Tax=Micromonospora peucetia TaxID=47871 RepID=A0A1C6VVU3_9ACTN|nr:MFS transporter [Micromonospora peucetia]MCX4388015.1 MFS transporter [Micromonospora peucetia]SCL70352.1 Predicted arabinose efflux permease, MFS family [Micromonospora peucetia]
MSGSSHVLRDRNGAAYLGAVVVSGFGTSAMMLVAGIWVMTLTKSTSLAALVTFLVWAPTLVGPVIGAVVDKVRQRRLVLIVSNLVMAVLLLSLLLVRSADQVWLLFVVMFLYGISFVASDAAETAILPSAIPDNLLADVNGLRMSASEGMKLVAPLAGAGLFSLLGGSAVAALDAATFVLAAYLCALIRPRPGLPVTTGAESDHTEGWLRGLVESTRLLWHHAALRRLVLVGSVTMFVAGVGGATVFAIVDQGLHRAPALVGVLAAVQGGGAVVGGLLAGPLMKRLSARLFVAMAVVLFAVGVLMRATPSLSPVVVASFLGGLSLPWVLVVVATSVQRDIPSAYLGRVAATVHMLTFAPNALGQALGAGLLVFVGYRMILLVAGAIALLAVLGCLWRFPVDRKQAGEEAGRADEQVPARPTAESVDAP